VMIGIERIAQSWTWGRRTEGKDETANRKPFWWPTCTQWCICVEKHVRPMT
jgi:hypothetical protein